MAAVVEFRSQPARNVRLHARAQAAEYVELADGHAEPAMPGTLCEPIDRRHGECSGTGRDRSAGMSGAPPVVALLVAAVLLAGFVVMSGVLRPDGQMVSGSAQSSERLPARSGDYFVVGPGDTLRSVAVEYAPAADQAQVVDAIRVLNGGERSVEVGQVLALPLLDQ